MVSEAQDPAHFLTGTLLAIPPHLRAHLHAHPNASSRSCNMSCDGQDIASYANRKVQDLEGVKCEIDRFIVAIDMIYRHSMQCLKDSTYHDIRGRAYLPGTGVYECMLSCCRKTSLSMSFCFYK
jgi:hypothetical protein